MAITAKRANIVKTLGKGLDLSDKSCQLLSDAVDQIETEVDLAHGADTLFAQLVAEVKRQKSDTRTIKRG